MFLHLACLLQPEPVLIRIKSPDQINAGFLLSEYKQRSENTCMKHTVFVDMDNQNEVCLIVWHSVFALVSS